MIGFILPRRIHAGYKEVMQSSNLAKSDTVEISKLLHVSNESVKEMSTLKHIKYISDMISNSSAKLAVFLLFQ